MTVSPRPLVIAGHSHTFVFGFNPTAGDGPAGLVPIPATRGETYGFATTAGPYQESYWAELAHVSAGKDVAVLWLGSQHLAEFLFEADTAFDFFVASRPDLAVDESAQLLPEALIREYQARHLAGLGPAMDRLAAQPGCRVFLVGTPPPKGDDADLRRIMMTEAFFQDRAQRAGLDLAAVPFTTPLVRLKLWLVIQDLLEEIGRSRGLPYIPVFASAVDESGFLRREYWESDVGHGNRPYGHLMLKAITSVVDSQ